MQRACNFHQLGYVSCLLMDNDDPSIDQAIGEAKKVGVLVYRWSPGNALEDEVVKTLPDSGVQALIDLAVSIRGEQSVQASVGAELGGVLLTGTDVPGWLAQAGVGEAAMRSAIAGASTAKAKEWFKREDRGEELAAVVIAHLDSVQSTHLYDVISALQAFTYDVAPEPLRPEDQSELSDE